MNNAFILQDSVAALEQLGYLMEQEVATLLGGPCRVSPRGPQVLAARDSLWTFELTPLPESPADRQMEQM